MKDPARLLAAIALIAVLAACQKSAPEPAHEPVRIENAALGLAIAALPEPFVVVINQGESFDLSAAVEDAGGELSEGRASIQVGPTEHAVNLVEAAKAAKAEIEALPGGQFFGNRELIVPSGTAYTARGSYQRDGATVEEVRVLGLHPGDNRRMLTVIYNYPPGETETRVPQILSLFGEIEAMQGESPAEQTLDGDANQG